jgi:hypothetical protein
VPVRGLKNLSLSLVWDGDRARRHPKYPGSKGTASETGVSIVCSLHFWRPGPSLNVN